jgi:hypothetical protein
MLFVNTLVSRNAQTPIYIFAFIALFVLCPTYEAVSQQSYVNVDFPANELWFATTHEYTNWSTLNFDHSMWPHALPVSGSEAFHHVVAESSNSASTMYLRGELNFTYEDLGSIQRVLVFIKANVSYELYFNGTYCGEDSTWPHGPLKVYDVTSLFNSTGKNIVAAKGWVISGTTPLVNCVVRLEYPSSVIIPVPGTDVLERRTMPTEISLSQNYPNPFNPTTNFEYTLNRKSKIKVEVFNELGQLVTTLVDGIAEAGNYQLSWNGKSSSGTTVSSGTYFYRLYTDGVVQTKKMIMIK